MTKKSIGYVIITVIIVGGCLTSWFYRYNIYDYFVLRGYNPPAAVSQLANDDTMNSYGKRLFFVSKPTISDRSTFSSECISHEQTIVLGCYSTGKIYIFKVDDGRLNGVEQVTAAHEMLHAAYNRLSYGERKKVDALVDNVYKRINDPRINSLAESYQAQDPGSVPNELHSIIATEVSDIGSELESYYGRYFTNRQQVVSDAKAYEQVFEDLRNQVASYDSQLSTRKDEITSRDTALSVKESQIKQLNEQMNTLLQNHQIDAYNGQVTTYNDMINSYNREVQAIKDLIEEYNSLVTARNAIVVQQQGLAQSIDSRPTAISN